MALIVSIHRVSNFSGLDLKKSEKLFGAYSNAPKILWSQQDPDVIAVVSEVHDFEGMCSMLNSPAADAFMMDSGIGEKLFGFREDG